MTGMKWDQSIGEKFLLCFCFLFSSLMHHGKREIRAMALVVCIISAQQKITP